MSPVASRRGSLLRWLIVLAVLAGAVGLVAALLGWSDAATTPATEPEDPTFIPMKVLPWRTTDTLPPADSNVSPAELVVGVSVGSAHRAYLLKSFDDIDHHVLNDLLAGQPVTVTHCPQASCTRVFTGPSGSRLQMRVGGATEETGGYRMVLRVGRGEYRQESGRSTRGHEMIPYPTLDHQLTTWGEWRKDHPDTDLYSGGGVAGY